MDNYVNFLNNFRNSVRSTERQANDAANRAMSQLGRDTGTALNAIGGVLALPALPVDLLRSALGLGDNTNTAEAQARSIEQRKAARRETKEAQQQAPTTVEVTTEETEETPSKTENDEDVITYVYRPGDTFGQVINDLGLRSGNGLWGSNGDVAYYTQQLAEQGAMDRYGSIPIGTTIKLRRRK